MTNKVEIDLSTGNVDRLLDYVDCKPNQGNVCKRRDAYVTEWHFETNVLPRITTGNSVTGWFYFEAEDTRYWCFVSDGAASRECSREVISRLQSINARQRFFAMHEVGGGYQVSEVVRKGEGFILSKDETLPRQLDIDGISAKVIELSEAGEHPSPFSSRWMKWVGFDYRKNLLLQRLWMNYGLSEGVFPLDVDAIEVRQEKVVFHEFKRKTQCPDGCFSDGGRIDKWGLIRIQQNCREAKVPYGEMLFAHVEGELRFPRRKELDCYGLDLQHLSNYEFCQKNGIEYIYTIWDSEDYPRKPSISDLFDNDLSPLSGMVLRSASIAPGNFVGFTFTHGENSGAFHGRLRIQIAIEAGCFKPVSI